MGVIDEVKQKIDIVEVIGQYASLKKAGRTFRALCPFHSEKHPSFFVYPEQQSWHCFGACNTGGDVFSFVMKKENVDFGEALRLLAQRAGITIPTRFEPDIRKDEKERLYQVNQATAQYFNNLLLNSAAGEKALKYITDRGLSPKTTADFQLGFSLKSWDGLKKHMMERGYSENELLTAGLVITAEAKEPHDRFRNRLMFPIQDVRGHVVGFGARVLDDSLPKYLNSPQTLVFDKSSCLYGINLAMAAIRQQSQTVIFEGYMDVITAHQSGFNNVVASMGTAVTEKQINTLKRLGGDVVLALDADAAGEEAMLRAVSYENILDTEIRVIVLPGGEDPDSMIRKDKEKWSGLLEQALPIMDYVFNMVTSGLDLGVIRDKRLVVDRLLPVVDGMKNALRKAHYLQKLAHLVKISEGDLKAALSQIKPGRGQRRAEESNQTTAIKVMQPLFSSPVEEYCLTLLLHHPELKNRDEGLLPEYFENSENREIFSTWQQDDAPSSLKNRLDSALWEYIDSLITRDLPSNQIEQKYTNCVLRLKEKYLRNLEIKRGGALAQEAEVGGTAAELAKLEEQGIEGSVQLGEIFTRKSRGG